MLTAPTTPSRVLVAIAAAILLASGSPAGRAEPRPAAELAARILKATGVKGGLVVHVGCGAGRLTAALHANDRYLVHGLDADAKNVASAREHIRSRDLYGQVAVVLDIPVMAAAAVESQLESAQRQADDIGGYGRISHPQAHPGLVQIQLGQQAQAAQGGAVSQSLEAALGFTDPHS